VVWVALADASIVVPFDAFLFLVHTIRKSRNPKKVLAADRNAMRRMGIGRLRMERSTISDGPVPVWSNRRVAARVGKRIEIFDRLETCRDKYAREYALEWHLCAYYAHIAHS
jgi:hypothetical protein